MIHAGVADNRQWENEFAHFAARFRVVRFDMRGYGRSEPVAGDFSHLRDLAALLDHLHIDAPMILMGCSMGGGIAMDFALTYPSRVRALIMVGSGPSGLVLDVPRRDGADDVEAAIEAAIKAGNLDRVAEIETQIWFDGIGRTSAQVNQDARKLAYAMCRNVAALESKKLGKRLPDADVPCGKASRCATHSGAGDRGCSRPAVPVGCRRLYGAAHPVRAEGVDARCGASTEHGSPCGVSTRRRSVPVRCRPTSRVIGGLIGCW
jgi:pimeloyl-ACP methyl ester carboxylesterase